MKHQKTHIGFYTNINKKAKKCASRVNGRIGTNMSLLKGEEYAKLCWYIYDGFINPYGYCIALYRFYKNLKYRKTYVYGLTKNTEERNRYMHLIKQIKTE